MDEIDCNKKNVDFEIEQFWLGFKNSMINFYKNMPLTVLLMNGQII